MPNIFYKNKKLLTTDSAKGQSNWPAFDDTFCSPWYTEVKHKFLEQLELDNIIHCIGKNGKRGKGKGYT